MPKPWYSIKAAADSDVAEISILDAINSWYGVNAQTYLAEFRALKASKVKVYINSPGGSVVEALAIFNGMRATGKQIEVHVLGIAASAASYIAMAGDKIVMPKNTLMFLHNPIAGAYGNAEELRDTADTLDKLGSMLTATYEKRFKGEKADLEKMMREEALLTADECLAHGFCDEVTDEIAATASFDVDTLPPEARKVFDAAANRAPAPESAPPVEPTANTLSEQVAAAAKAGGVDTYTAILVSDPEIKSIEQAQAAIGRIREIVALAKYTGLADRADALVRGRKSVDEARAALAAVLADADASTHVNTTPRSPKADAAAAADFSPTALWADINAKKAGSK